MPDRRQTLRTDITIDSRDAQRDIGKLGSASKDAAVDIDRLARELKSAERPAKEFGDTAERAGDDAESAFERTGESAFVAASSVGEAFGGQGDAAQAVGSFNEVIEQVAGSFGPIGIAAGVAGAALISGIVSVLERSKQRAEELKATTEAMFQALIEGKGKLDEAYKDDSLRTFIEENLELSEQLEQQMPGSLALVREALGGNEKAYNTLTSQIRNQIDALNAQRTAGGQLRPELQTQYDALVALQGQLEDNNGALQTAMRQTGLYTNATNANTDALYRNEQQARRTNAARIGTSEVRGGTQQYYDYHSTGSGRAAGGPVTAGTAYPVGEHGTELFVPDVDGTIVPAATARPAPPAPHVTIHQTIVSNDPARIGAQTAQALRREAWRYGR